VPAIAGIQPEARFYHGIIFKCWKLIFSEHISKEYQRVINEYGYTAVVIIHEQNKLYAMNKYRYSDANPENVEDELAPRRNRHIVAPCKQGRANVIVTNDPGIHQRKTTILRETGARVLSLSEAQQALDAE